MKVDFPQHSTPHFWISGVWCAFGAIVFCVIAVITCWIRKCRSSYRKKRKKNVRRAQSAAEFDQQTLTAAYKRNIFKGRSASSEHENSESEQTEKSPLVSAKLETFAKILFNRTLSSQDSCSSNTIKDNLAASPTRSNVKFQYTALDSGLGQIERSPRERVNRDRAYVACQNWIENSKGRYEIILHLDDIGCRNNKHWFLLNDTTIKTDRLMTLLKLPPDCVALHEMPPSESPKGVLMELLSSLQHPYIYPVLDLGFLYSNDTQYACLVMPFNSRGSLKDLIYKSQWNEPWNRKYTRKSACLPISQVQRLGRQILEALLFLRERGFPSHGHLHSGNVILQNGVARLSGLENGLLSLNSKVNAVVWSRNVTSVEHMDIICFGHLLFEMCAGYELTSPHPSAGHLQLDLDRYPQVVEVLQLIFESPENRFPTIEELVLCDLFRNIDLREMRGPSVSSFNKYGLSSSTLNLLNAVRRRQGASLSGSYSEGSSPCTPPSTPRDKRIGSRDIDSFEISTDTDDVLDEIVITPSSFDAKLYDILHLASSSPIHFCDNSTHSDENSATQPPSKHQSQSDDTDTCPTSYSNQLTTDSCTSKNSKSRRMEYSMRGMKMYNHSNPSQDSAFGSMTDGELSIASSSIRMSSFQSISSPIDEGVEDTATGLPGPQLSSTYTPSNEIDSIDTNMAQSTSEMNLTKRRSPNITPLPSMAFGPSIMEPPTILVNDQNSFYTTSPGRSCNTIEVFSQKYRVSSFEDMSNKKVFVKNVSKPNFRSLEEERRIDSAFTPINKYTTPTPHYYDPHRVHITNPEKFKKLTHSSFARKNCTTKERHTMWTNSILARKNILIRSNESLSDYQMIHNTDGYSKPSHGRHLSNSVLHKRVNSTNELSTTSTHLEFDRDLSLDEELKLNPRKSSSERYLLNLNKLKQSTTHDYEECEEDEANAISCSEIETFIDDTSSSSGAITKADNESSDSSSSHRDMCNIIGGIEKDTRCTEEKIPLLEGMEMSPMSPVDADELL